MKRLRPALRHENRSIAWLMVLCVVLALVVLFVPAFSPAGEKASNDRPAQALFVGDVMLARHVETLAGLHGVHYLFRGVRDTFAEHDLVIGNFEASIPERHVKTPSLTFRFSVDRTFVPVLARVGFTDFSLANNHAYDSGAEGYAHTVSTLTDAGMSVHGHPLSLSTSSIAYQTLGNVQLALIGINATYHAPSHADAQALVEHAAAASDLQIVSVHWGVEYAQSANVRQQALAHALVDAGADAIIGHHPHVVQNIEVYRNAPIFYSLGNFVFDQYWNTAVQEGLMVSLSIVGDEARFALIPTTSVDTRSVPRPMSRVERVQFLDALAERSDTDISDAIRNGVLVRLYAPVATSQ